MVEVFDWRVLGNLLLDIYSSREYDVYDPVNLRVLEWTKQLSNLGESCRVVRFLLYLNELDQPFYADETLSTRGTFATHVARGVVQTAPSEYSVQLISYSAFDVDVLLRELHASQPEILVLAGSFEQEIQIMRARRRWPASIRAVAAVAAGVQPFYDELGRAVEGVIGPSQSEAHASFSAGIGPDAFWFLRNFRKQFRRKPEYTAAGSFAVGLIFKECVRRAGSLQDNNLLATAAELDGYTFYGRFRLDSASRRQVGHRILLIRWVRDHKVLLPTGNIE